MRGYLCLWSPISFPQQKLILVQKILRSSILSYKKIQAIVKRENIKLFAMSMLSHKKFPRQPQKSQCLDSVAAVLQIPKHIIQQGFGKYFRNDLTKGGKKVTIIAPSCYMQQCAEKEIRELNYYNRYLGHEIPQLGRHFQIFWNTSILIVHYILFLLFILHATLV